MSILDKIKIAKDVHAFYNKHVKGNEEDIKRFLGNVSNTLDDLKVLGKKFTINNEVCNGKKNKDTDGSN